MHSDGAHVDNIRKVRDTPAVRFALLRRIYFAKGHRGACLITNVRCRMKLTHSMILAAGLGTRMLPLTETMPKPLIPVAGKPLIDWNLDWLQAAGLEQVVINTSYLADQLEVHLATRVAPRITLSREGTPALETGGGIAKALPLLGDAPFLTMNADAILLGDEEHPIARMEAAWSDDLDFLMLIVPTQHAHGWAGAGDFIMAPDGRIRRPRLGSQAKYVFTGVEIIHPRVFRDCPEGPFSLTKLWKNLETQDDWHQRIRAVVYEGAWLNVGDLHGLAEAERYLAKA